MPPPAAVIASGQRIDGLDHQRSTLQRRRRHRDDGIGLEICAVERRTGDLYGFCSTGIGRSQFEQARYVLLRLTR